MKAQSKELYHHIHRKHTQELRAAVKEDRMETTLARTAVQPTMTSMEGDDGLDIVGDDDVVVFEEPANAVKAIQIGELGKSSENGPVLDIPSSCIAEQSTEVAHRG